MSVRHQEVNSRVPDTEAGLRVEISQTREDLGNTIEALALKMNVKEQARRKAAATAERARAMAGSATARNAMVCVAGIAALAFAAGWLIRQARR